MAIKQLGATWNGHLQAWTREYICDTDEDLANLPEAAPGSQAICVASGTVYMVNASGEWAAFGG